jgi:hypothetical protein
MGTRAKLVAFSLGTLAVALPLLVLVALPTPQPPGMVEPIDLQAPRGGEQRADGRTHVPTAGRQRQRSRRRDRRSPVSARRAQERSGAATSRSISTGEAGAQAQRTLPERAAPEAPTVGPRSESGPRAGGSPTPRGTPVSGTPPAPGNSPPEVDSPPEPSDPPDPPHPPQEEATSAAVDPPEEPEPADGDPPEESEPADGEPPM